jgi:hypothetical protein
LLVLRTVLYLPFAEPAGVAPSDRKGTLEDLTTVTGLARPTRTMETFTGGGHAYVQADLNGWQAADADDGDSLLQRDVTIQALVIFDKTHAADPACLVCRGLDGSASEYYGWGLELADQGGGLVEMRWLWMTSAGVLAAVIPGVYEHPGDTAEILLTATRRWESTTRVVCRYFANATLLAEVVSADGDIGGGTTGHTSVGARKAGGVWGNGWSGVIDQLKVTDYEMSPEEVAAVYERMTVHQPNGVIMLRALEPPGVPWSQDLSSDMGKLLTAAGQGLGMAAAAAEELRANALPDRAYADLIGRWEGLVGLPQNARTPLDTRRALVVHRLAEENGYAVPLVQQALAAPFDLDAGDVEILEFTPTIEDGFATLELERWHLEPVSGANWSIVGGELQLAVAAPANMRFDNVGGWHPYHARTPVDVATAMIAQVKVTFWGGVPANVTAGLFLYHHGTHDALWFGPRFEGGVHKIVWQATVGGVAGAVHVLVNPASNAAYYLRARKVDAAGASHWTLEWNTTGFADAMTSTTVATGIHAPNYVGVAAMDTAGGTGSDLAVTFDDFLARLPRGRRAFHWYALRDPGLPGSPDMLGANAVVRTIKPAHTYGAAIQSRSLLCDDTASGCDRGPMGGL